MLFPLGQMLCIFYAVGGAILYCATPRYTTVGADAACFSYGWLRNALLCYPPPTLILGQMLPVLFYTVGGAILYCAILPTLLLGDPLLCYPRTLHLG